MKKETLIHVMLCFLWLQSITVLGQSIRFSEFYDNNNGTGLIESIVLLQNGNMLGVGSNLNPDNGFNQDGFHVLINEDGSLIQDHVFSFPNKTFNVQQVIKDESSESLYSAGYFCEFDIESPSYCDFYFSKLTPTGDTVFTKFYKRKDTCDLLLDMIQTQPNKIMLMGWSCNDTTEDNPDLMFITVDTMGNEVNRVIWGGSGIDYVHSGISIGEVGEVYMTGYTSSFLGSDNDTWFLKTDSIGNVIFHKTYNHLSPSGGDGGLRVASLSDGNFLILGGSENPITGNSDGYMLKVDPTGEEIWTHKFIPSAGSQGFLAGFELEDGSIVACGQTTDTPDETQAGWLIKTDSNGDTLWTRTYNPSDIVDRLINMLVLPNSDIVMVGSGFALNATDQDGWILRVDSMGCLVENCLGVGIDELSLNDEALKVWPNPASDVVYVEFTDSSARSSVGMTVRVVDMLGRVNSPPWKEGSGEVIEVNTSHLPNGIYLITVTDQDGNSYTKRLVVQH